MKSVRPTVRCLTNLVENLNNSTALANQCGCRNKSLLSHRRIISSTVARKMSTNETGVAPPPKCLFKPMKVPRKLLMGPGPSNPSPKVYAAATYPLIGHLHTDYHAILDEVMEGLRYIFQTENKLTFAVQGSGHAAMECAATNLVEPGDSVVVGVNGLWGSRFSTMVERNGGVLHEMKKEMGTVFSLEDVEKALKEHKPKLMFLVHAESSGSTCQPLEGFGDLCHKYDCLLVVDTVASMGGVPLFVDKWGIDVCYSGSQKALAVPPGVAPITFSEAACKKAFSRKNLPTSYYLDLKELANYWGCDDQPRRYHHTSPVSTMYQLREGLSIVAEEGLEAMWARHVKYAKMLQQGVRDMGLELFASDQEHQLLTVTGIKIPEGINGKEVSDYCMKEYNMELAGGLGAGAGLMWRIGVMGYNCREDNVLFTLRVFREALEHVGYKTKNAKL